MSETTIERAIRFRRQDAALHCDLAVLADAYIAMLDEQAALNVPYDFEWLEARPEFEREGLSLISQIRGASMGIIRVVENYDGSWTWWVIEDDSYVGIPPPATKADVLNLLEVFCGGLNE